jgi:hypothetical protein
MLDMIKKFFAWDSVGTIVKSRLEMIGAAIAAGVAAIASYGWIPYVTDTIEPMKLAIIAAIVGVNGAVTEFVRRWNAKDI